MSKHAGTEGFVHAEKFFDGARPIAEKAVTVSAEFCQKAATAAQEGAKALAEIVDAAWTNTKILNDKVLQNTTTNVGAALTAAREMAAAKSPLEMGQIQTEFIQRAVGKATEQSREFFDLSTRATQQVLETVHAAAAKSLMAKK
jgi:hypothetical protein